MPFVGVGIALPSMAGKSLQVSELSAVADQMGIAAAKAWPFIDYETWGVHLSGLVDTILAVAARPFKASSPDVHGRPPVCQASSSLLHEEKIAPVHSVLSMRHELAVPDGFCWSTPNRIHALEVPRPARAVPTTV